MSTILQKLEDWLMDIERAANLTKESQAKLAKAKSRGLILTFFMEAINSDKTWEEIKDLLQLKLLTGTKSLWRHLRMKILWFL